jgi:hypothetical protein
MLRFRQIAEISSAILLALVLPVAAQACSGSVHVELHEAGVYALDHDAIVAAQPGLGDCRSDDLVLTQRGQPVPLHVVGGNAGGFGAGARIEWIGEPLHGPASWFDPYSSVNVYILSAKAGANSRMQATGAQAGGRAATLLRHAHFEQENEFIRLNRTTMKPGDEPDVWQWARMTHADTQPFTYEFDLPDLGRNGAAPATVAATLDFRGISYISKPQKEGAKAPDHVIDVTINGKRVSSVHWNGRNETRQQVAVPRALLKATGNVLTMQVPVRYLAGESENPIVDMTMFNWFELEYPVEGDLDASAASLAVETAQGKTPVVVELSGAKSATVALYGGDGRMYADSSTVAGHHRFAGVVPGNELYPVVGGEFRKPDLVRAVAAHDWRNVGAGYDYLIVSHPSLIDAVGPLAEFHRRDGLKVAVIDVDEVYDQFNGGISHPVAIKDLIDHARAQWTVKPRYVLLVGTASFDIRAAGKVVTMQPDDYNPATGVSFTRRVDAPAGTGPASRNLIPTWQYPSDEGQSASDNRFVATSDKDFHPALAIGRLPVVTAAEAAAIVRKTIEYVSAPDIGSWRRRVMFIANEDASYQRSSDEIAHDVGAEGFASEKIYGNHAESDNLAHQAAINAGLNSGDLLVHFIGHGGRFIWRTGPPDLNKNHDLFTLDDVSNLRNGRRLPMVLSMTCFSAPFDNPSEDSIGERFLREPDKGAVAVFAASWSNAPSPDFSRKLVAELIKPGQTIGDAIVAAKKEINNETMVEMYNLLGDPALVLERPRDRIDIARSGDRWQERIAVRVPEAGFGGEVTVDWVDASGKPVVSQTYEARDPQFELAVPSPAAAGVRIYAANYRSGRDALGTFELRPAPPPVATQTAKNKAAPVKTVPAKGTPGAAPAAPPAAAPAAAPASGASKTAPRGPDHIARAGFDEPHPDAAKSPAPFKNDSSRRSTVRQTPGTGATPPATPPRADVGA